MTAPWARLAPLPQRPAEPAPRPHLRVVRPVDPAVRRRRRSRLVTTVLATLACAGLFAIVGLRAVLAQGQAEVDRLSAQVGQVEADQQRLRLLVAERESPRAIVSAARERLGMVPLAPAAHLPAVSAARSPSVAAQAAQSPPVAAQAARR